MRVSVTPRLKMHTWNSGQGEIYVTRNKNTFYEVEGDRVIATQRPGINTYEDASGQSITDTQGRGFFYWDFADATYFVNNDTVYKSSYLAPLGNTITAGTQRVEFFIVGNYLVLIDVENNQGWTINGSVDTTTLTEITNVNFPPKQTPALTLARGGASLNNTLFVLTTDGDIYNSSVEDPTTWAANDFVNAEVNTDGGVVMFPHNQNLAVLGNKSIEFFYYASNPTNSPASPRSDIMIELGGYDSDSVFSDADQAFFVGVTRSGHYGVYVMQGFNVTKISESDMDSMLTTSITNDGLKLMGSGVTVSGKTCYVLTTYFIQSGSINPIQSFVYISGQGWSDWDLCTADVSHFPLVSFVQGVSTRAGQGILSNGDIVSILDDFNPTDTVEATGWVAAGWVNPGWVSSTGASGCNIEMELILEPIELGVTKEKYMSELKIAGVPTDATKNVLVQWSDEGYNSYNTGKSIDISNPKNKMTRGGNFFRRSIKLSYSGSEKWKTEGVDVDLS